MKKPKKKKREYVWLAKDLDCKECPYPQLRDQGMCSLCATLCKDEETGERFVSIKPITEEKK